MAAPTFVQKVQHEGTGGSPHTVSFGSATTSGNLLTLAVYHAVSTAVTTPTGWTRVVDGLLITTGLPKVTIFYRTSDGLTNVDVSLDIDTGDTEIVATEHAGLANATPYAAYVYRRTAGPGPGYGIMPAVSYPAEPVAIMGWCAMQSGGGPAGTDTLQGSGTGVTLRTPIAGGDAQHQLGMADILLDPAASGATALYPASGGWRFLFTNTQALVCIGLAFIAGTVTPPVSCDFTSDAASGTAPLDIQFFDQSTGSPDGWSWDFGDGDTSTDQNPTHTYTVTGVYDVSLTVTRSSDADECTKTITAYIVVGQAGVWIDWDNDGFENGDHDAIHLEPDSRVISWTITRGASAEITGGANPGSATLTLKNPSDVYNPRNVSSPLYGLLTDGRPVWIGPNSDGKLTGDDPRGLFGGRTTDITLIPAGGAADSPTVEIACEDMLSWAQRTSVQIDYAEGRAHDELRADALATAGETRTDLDHEIHTMPLSHADGDLGSVLDGINGINGTRHLAKPSNVYTDWFRYTTYNRQHGLAGTSAAALDAGADHVTDTSGWRLSADTVTNQQRATVTPIVFTPGTFTVWQAEAVPFSVTDSRTFSQIVSFDDVVRDPVLNIASTGDTVTATLTPFATAAKLDLSVAAGDEASITGLSIEGRLARRLEQGSYVADDMTSQAAPRGIRAGSEIGNEYLGVLASARGIAEHVVWRYGNPQLRPTLTVENWFPEQFELDLYDVIAFTSSQLGMAGVLFEIVGLTHTSDVAADEVQHHITTYVLQESRVQTPYDWFYLDSGPNSSVLDGDFHLAY